MQELSSFEVSVVSGGGTIFDVYSDIKSIVLDFPSFFDGLVNSTVDVACRISGNC